MMEFPLIDETDHAILMHKDAHFNGSFAIMLDYYVNEGKGTIDTFELERIQALALIEEQYQVFLSEELLSDEEKKEVIRSKIKYRSLKELYDLPSHPSQKIADLIFSEEMDPLEEIEALSMTPEAIPLLIDLIQEDDFYNPLFPGYGLAPLHAIECLGQLKAKEAIIPLFECLGKSEFFGEEAVIQALFAIGDPAKEFLLSRLKKTPISKENENAAIALLPFKDDSRISDTCLHLLEIPEVQQNPLFFTYLLLLCDELKEDRQKNQLLQISNSKYLSKENQVELDWIIKSLSK